MTSDAIAIDTLRCRYLVSSAHPSPESVRARLDEVAATAVPAALAQMLDGQLPGGIWLVRRLELDVAVNAAADGAAIARLWAQGIARAVLDEISGPPSDNVVRFVNAADRLRRFLVHLARGVAWQQWYYGTFEGLKPLPVSAAIRSAILTRDEANEALAAMATPEQELVVASLCERDARLVFQHLAAQAPQSGGDGALRAVGAAAATNAGSHERGTRATLLLALAARRLDPDAGGPALVDACGALIEWREHRAGPHASALLAALRRHDTDAVRVLVGADAAERLAPLAGAAGKTLDSLLPAAGDGPGLDRDGSLAGDRPAVLGALSNATGVVAGAVRTGPDGPRPDPPLSAGRPPASVLAEAPRVRVTRFGGAFILLPHLARLPLEKACAGWPDADGVPGAALVRWLVLVKALDGGSWEATGDTVLRAVCGVPLSLDGAVVRRWQRRVRPTEREALVVQLAEWRRAQGDAPGAWLRVAGARLGRHRVALVIDEARGLWLRAAAATRSHAGHTAASVEEQADLDALAAPASRRSSVEMDLTLAVVAQGLCRDVAWRLPGFSDSHVAYLRRNFLAFAATIEDAPDRRIVTLGRPPLDLILRMTGATRRDYVLPWLDDRPFAIFPGE